MKTDSTPAAPASKRDSKKPVLKLFSEPERQHVEALLDEALDETFPASDPVQPIHFT